MKFYLFSALLLLSALTACDNGKNNGPLPYLGFPEITANGDTIPFKIPDFQFVDQDSTVITQATFAGKIYITDFFFTSCPTICPKVKRQMMRVYDKFKDEPRLVMLSHSIDTKYDTVATLRHYAEKLGISSSRWHLVTGDKAKIYEMASKYMISALEDANEPGGYVHSGAIALIDVNGHIRGSYGGTEQEEVDQLMLDIEKLLKETPVNK